MDQFEQFYPLSANHTRHWVRHTLILPCATRASLHKTPHPLPRDLGNSTLLVRPQTSTEPPAATTSTCLRWPILCPVSTRDTDVFFLFVFSDLSHSAVLFNFAYSLLLHFIATPLIDTIARLVSMMSLHTEPPSGYGFDWRLFATILCLSFIINALMPPNLSFL